jgi:hypothetical protein
MPKNPTVTVITASTGHAGLVRCLESVRDQTYNRLKHVLVIDGPKWVEGVESAVEEFDGDVDVVKLPYPTGEDRFVCHRIYGAFPFLVNSDFVCWLDDDNWFDPRHIESLVQTHFKSGAPWAFSLRKIVDLDGNYLGLDNCESLGNLHHTSVAPGDFLVDTNCYLVERTVAVGLAPLWHARARRRPHEPEEPDRHLCRWLMREFPHARCTMEYSVNYTVANTPESSYFEFFQRGNEEMLRRYGGKLPWA